MAGTITVGKKKKRPAESENEAQERPVTSIRLSPEARQIIEEMRQFYGVSQTGAIEMALREKYRRDFPEKTL